MKYHRIILILISTFFVPCSSPAQQLDDKYYTNKDLSDFIDTERANMTINPDNIDVELLNALLFHLTNEQRLAHEQAVFVYHNNLKLAAEAHSKEMADKQFFSHKNRFNKKMREPSDRIFSYQDDYLSIGENIVENNLYEYSGRYLEYRILEKDGKQTLVDGAGVAIPHASYLSLANRLMQQWMNSPPHKKNILSTDFSLLGCACAVDDSQLIWKMKCTQNFGHID